LRGLDGRGAARDNRRGARGRPHHSLKRNVQSHAAGSKNNACPFRASSRWQINTFGAEVSSSIRRAGSLCWP
jgi:hypothetical protein